MACPTEPSLCVVCGSVLDERFDHKNHCLYCYLASGELRSKSVIVSTETGKTWQKPRLVPEDEWR